MPPRMTVRDPKALGVQAKPKRGLNIFETVENAPGRSLLANVSPPSALNALAGTSGTGLAAYAAAAAAEVLFGAERSKPLIRRPKRSLVGVSCSKRRPKFNVRLR